MECAVPSPKFAHTSKPETPTALYRVLEFEFAFSYGPDHCEIGWMRLGNHSLLALCDFRLSELKSLAVQADGQVQMPRYSDFQSWLGGLIEILVHPDLFEMGSDTCNLDRFDMIGYDWYNNWNTIGIFLNIGMLYWLHLTGSRNWFGFG